MSKSTTEEKWTNSGGRDFTRCREDQTGVTMKPMSANCHLIGTISTWIIVKRNIFFIFGIPWKFPVPKNLLNSYLNLSCQSSDCFAEFNDIQSKYKAHFWVENNQLWWKSRVLQGFTECCVGRTEWSGQSLLFRQNKKWIYLHSQFPTCLQQRAVVYCI